MEMMQRNTDAMRARKKAIRKEVRERKAAMREEDITREALEIFNGLGNLPLFAEAKEILLYQALPDELPTRPFLEALLGKKRLALPVVSGDDLVLLEYTGAECLKPVPPFGVLEPQGTPAVNPESIRIALIPGVAFDDAGWRVGRGKGYYDRFLTQYSHICRVGIAFPCQRYAAVPHEAHDIRMDYVFFDAKGCRTSNREFPIR